MCIWPPLHENCLDENYFFFFDVFQGLAFQVGSHELFSCSFDRTVKIWNLDEMAYVETLYAVNRNECTHTCCST